MKKICILLFSVLCALARAATSQQVANPFFQGNATGSLNLAGVTFTSAPWQPVDTDLTAIAALNTTSFGRGLLTEASASSLKLTLSLGNVDNTSDASKPISTATQAALDGKAAAGSNSDLTALNTIGSFTSPDVLDFFASSTGGGAERRMRLARDGKLGIGLGSAAPGAYLHVDGPARLERGIYIGNTRANHKIYTLGDSQTWTGYYQARLESDLGVAWKTVNKGVQGYTSASVFVTYERDVLTAPIDAEVVGLWVGINDVQTDVLPATTLSTIQSIVTGLKSGGVPYIYLVNVPPWKGYPTWTSGREANRLTVNAGLSAITGVDQVIDIDVLVRDPADHQKLAAAYDGSDHLHFSSGGYIVLADRISAQCTFTPGNPPAYGAVFNTSIQTTYGILANDDITTASGLVGSSLTSTSASQASIYLAKTGVDANTTYMYNVGTALGMYDGTNNRGVWTYSPANNSYAVGGILVAGSSGVPLTTSAGFIQNAALLNSSITFGSTAAALGSTVSALNNVAIGSTTPSTGAFTSVSGSSVTVANASEADLTLAKAGVNTSSLYNVGSSVGMFDNTNGRGIWAYSPGSNLFSIGSPILNTTAGNTLTLQANGTTVIAFDAGLAPGTATFAGRIITPATTNLGAYFNLPHGTAPGSPQNGDLWTTSSGLFVRVNGGTVGPLGAGGGGGITNGSGGSSTNNAVPRWSGTGGNSLLDSGVLIDGSNNMSGVASLKVAAAGVKIGDATNGPTITASGTSPDESISITGAGAGSAQLKSSNGKSIISAGPNGGYGRGLIYSESGDVAVRIQNAVSSGYSSIDFLDDGGNVKANMGYANASAGVAPGKMLFYAPSGVAFRLYTNGTQALEIDTSQNATFAGTLIAPAATASLAPLRIPHGAAPSSPTNGDIWTTTSGAFVRINGVTQTIATLSNISDAAYGAGWNGVTDAPTKNAVYDLVHTFDADDDGLPDKLDKVTTYNAATLVGNGLPAQVATVDLTSQSAAVGATTLVTPGADGWYRISAILKITTTGTSPVAGPITITYNDGDGNVAQSQVMLLRSTTGTVVTTTVNNSTTLGTVNGDMVIYAKSGTAIQYAIATSGTFGSGRYSAHLRLEAL